MAIRCRAVEGGRQRLAAGQGELDLGLPGTSPSGEPVTARSDGS